MKSSVIAENGTLTVRQRPVGTLALLVACGAMGLICQSAFYIIAENFGLSFWDVLLQSPLLLALQLAFLCCVAVGVWLARRYRTGKPILIVNADGVMDNSSMLSFGFIPWRDVAGIRIGEVQRQRFIELEIADENAFLCRLPRWKQRMLLLNRGMGHELVCITLSTSGLSPEDVLPQMQELFARSHDN